MDEAPTVSDVDLSGYTVTLSRVVMGWKWKATAPGGDNVPGFPPGIDIRLYGQRTVAEARALESIEAHARGGTEVSIDGEELRRRVLES